MNPHVRNTVAALAVALLATAAGPAVAQEDAGSTDETEAESTTRLQIEADPVRSYDIPDQFPLSNRIVDSTAEGRTMIANTTGSGTEAACTIVVATGESAEAFPYRHSDEGTRCVGVSPHPEGGFFVRGMRAGAEMGEVAGFTARLDADGGERWLVHDTETAESDDFRGAYQQPHSPLAYSSESNYLLTFATGKLTIGSVDEKDVTHVSVVRDGEMRVPAKTIGSGGGFGIIGGVDALESTGDFLLYIYSPGSQGANFYTYDGRRNVDAFDPLGEDWSSRFVRQMTYGPDANIYLLWTISPKENATTHVAVVDDEAAEVWTGSYPSEIALPSLRRFRPDAGSDAGADADAGSKYEEVQLGSPSAMWVGSEHVVILYAANAPYLRVLDATTGEEVGVAPLAGATSTTPINILKGEEGRLKLLTVDDQMTRFHEFQLEFETVDLPDKIPENAGEVAQEVAKRACGGCSTAGSALLPPFAILWLLGIFGLLRRR